MDGPGNHSNLSFQQTYTPQDSTDVIQGLRDCLARCTAIGDIKTQDCLTKIILSATSTAQRVISLQEENDPTGTKLKELEQANSESTNQIKALNAKNRALKDSKLELQISANWYKERLMESQLAEKERFHTEKMLNSRLSKAFTREENVIKNAQQIRLSFEGFFKRLTEIYGFSVIEDLLDDNLREWVNFKGMNVDTFNEPHLYRRGTQGIIGSPRDVDLEMGMFQPSRAGVRSSKQSEINLHANDSDHQYNNGEYSSSFHQDSRARSYYHPHWTDPDNIDDESQHLAVEITQKLEPQFRANASFKNQRKVNAPRGISSNSLQEENQSKESTTANFGVWGHSHEAGGANSNISVVDPSWVPGSWNDVPTPPELLRRKKIAKKQESERVIKLTRLPVGITTFMIATFVRGGKIEEMRIVAAERNNSYKQAIITFCRPEAAAKFFDWVQEHPGSLVVDGLRCHAVVGVTNEPPTYDREVRVLLLSRLPETISSIDKLREFIERTSHNNKGQPFTIQDQKIYFNGGGSKISASVTFDSIEGAIHMKTKWESGWGMIIEWGWDECEGEVLDMEPQMKYFWLTQPKPSFHQ